MRDEIEALEVYATYCIGRVKKKLKLHPNLGHARREITSVRHGYTDTRGLEEAKTVELYRVGPSGWELVGTYKPSEPVPWHPSR